MGDDDDYEIRDREYGRREYITAGTLVTLGGLAGCIGTGGSNGGNSSNGSGAITIWHDAWDDQVPDLRAHIQEAVDGNVEFSKQRYDTIRQNYLTGATTGDPDVVELTPTARGDFVSAELVEPMDDYISELDYADGYLGMDAMSHDDTTWALPYTGNGRGTVYRQDILEKYGYEMPENWEEFINMCSDITAQEDSMYGFTLTSEKGNTRMFQEYISMLFQITDRIFEPVDDGWELAVSAEDLGRVMKAYYWDPFYATDPPASNPDARGIGSLEHDVSYLNGNYAAIQTGSFIAGQLEGSENINEQAQENFQQSAVAHNPRIEGGEIGTYSEFKPVFMNIHSENKEQAWNALRAATSPEGIRLFHEQNIGNIPPHEDVEWTGPADLGNEDFEVFREIFESGITYGFWSLSEVTSPFFNLTQQVIYDDTDPMEAGNQLHSQWSEMASNL